MDDEGGGGGGYLYGGRACGKGLVGVFSPGDDGLDIETNIRIPIPHICRLHVFLQPLPNRLRIVGVRHPQRSTHRRITLQLVPQQYRRRNDVGIVVAYVYGMQWRGGVLQCEKRGRREIRGSFGSLALWVAASRGR